MASIDNIAVLGAGQIGTRHVQSLAAGGLGADLWIIDPSADARRLVESRLAEAGVEVADRLRFGGDMSELPESIEIAVIATNSAARLAVLEELLRSREVRWIILEKFLFPRSEDYSRAAELLEDAGAAAFVNCPRRLFDGYAELKRELEGPIRIRVSGANWGLACNSVHWFDLLDFLSPSNDYEIRSSLSAPKEAKRRGYVEFFGRVQIADSCGNHLEMICDDEGPLSSSVEISDASGRRWEISEGSRQLTTGRFNAPFPVPFQSELTAGIARGLLERQSCGLTPFHRSARLHEILLREFLEAYNMFNCYEGNDFCPIT